MGLGCAALTGNPRFPTYPNPLTAEQVSAGLTSPATAITLMGKGGAVLLLILLFMAVTSSTSAELIAVSSLLTFDIYKTYFRPNAPSAKLVQISHWGIIIYAVVLAAFCCILNAAGLSLTWLLTVLGIIVGGGSVPVGLVLLWDKMSTVAAVGAPWIGLCCGLVAWFITTSRRSGEITVASSGDTLNALAGNITSWGVGLLVAVVFSFLFPGKRRSTDAMHNAHADKIEGVAVDTTPSPPSGGNSSEDEKATGGKADIVSSSNDKTATQTESQTQTQTQPQNHPPPQAQAQAQPETFIPTGNELVDYLESKHIEPMDSILVKKAERLAWGANIVFLTVAVLLVPFTLFGTEYIYSRSFFTGWVVVSFIWIWVSMVICVIYPVVSLDRRM